MKRRLAAIVAADVAGFSRLVGADEEGTLAALRALRSELVDPLLAAHGGRVANTAGDSLLIEFPSAVEAVRCAVLLQERVAARAAGEPEDRRIVFRVGVNVGDVVAEGADLLGDGVNVAARLEALAPPGGIVLSRAARDQVRDRLDVTLADLGEVEVKNIARPVRAFRVLREGESRPTRRRRRSRAAAIAAAACLAASASLWWTQRTDVTPADPAKMAYALPDEPSIAVLAFDNLTGDPAQDHVAEGLSENVVSVLSRLPGVMVIAPNSSFAYRDAPAPIGAIAEELGVQHVLAGSLQQSDETIRVTARLIDAISGRHVWSRSYDRPRADFFEVRDAITREIAAALHVEVGASSDSYWMRAEGFETMDAWILSREAAWHAGRWNGPDNQIAVDLIRRALELEPGSAAAHAQLGWRQVWNARMRWTDDPAAALKAGVAHAETAIALDPDHPDGPAALAMARFLQGRFKDAVALGERVLELAPGDAGALGLMAYYLQKDMQFDRSIELFERALRVDRNAGSWAWENYGESLLLAGRCQDAIPQFERALAAGSDGLVAGEAHLGLAFCHDALGDPQAARASIARTAGLSPRFTIALVKRFRKFSDPSVTDRYVEAMRRLGLPEG